MAGLSGRHGGQLDDRIIAQRRDRFQALYAISLEGVHQQCNLEKSTHVRGKRLWGI
jgi:hypothetical protein